MGAAVPDAMPQFKVVLVGPRVDGNVGAVARSMANFGFAELCMVRPCGPKTAGTAALAVVQGVNQPVPDVQCVILQTA